MIASDPPELIDLLIIGAGVAGASAALSAARTLDPTRRVLLVDRSTWPREKVCGCCLGAAGVAAIQRLGLRSHEHPLDGVPLERVRVTARGGASFNVPHAGGMVVSRSVLDAALVRAAVDSGASFRPRCSASVLRRLGDAWQVRLGNQTCLARLVIVADGLAGHALSTLSEFAPQVARGAFMGLGVHMPASAAVAEVAPKGTVQLAHGVGGYVGLVRCVDGSIDVAAALCPRRVRSLGGPINAMQRLLDDAHVYVTLDPTLRVMGTPLLTRRRKVLGGTGLIIAGDAAGYVEPFTGEGMTWAALAGEHAGALAAHAINTRCPTLDEIGTVWSKWHQHELVPTQRACGTIRRLLRTPGLLRSVTTIAERSRSVHTLLANISTRVTAGSATSAGTMPLQRPLGAWASPTSAMRMDNA